MLRFTLLFTLFAAVSCTRTADRASTEDLPCPPPLAACICETGSVAEITPMRCFQAEPGCAWRGAPPAYGTVLGGPCSEAGRCSCSMRCLDGVCVSAAAELTQPICVAPHGWLTVGRLFKWLVLGQ